MAAAPGDGPESHPALLDRRIRPTALAATRRGLEAAYAGDRSRLSGWFDDYWDERLRQAA